MTSLLKPLVDENFRTVLHWCLHHAMTDRKETSVEVGDCKGPPQMIDITLSYCQFTFKQSKALRDNCLESNVFWAAIEKLILLGFLDVYSFSEDKDINLVRVNLLDDMKISSYVSALEDK